MTEQTQPRYFISDIIDHASEVFGVLPKDITSKSRQRHHFIVRAAVMLVARELTPLSLPEIGRRLGGRDHSTIGHALERAKEMIAFSPAYSAMVHEIRTRMKGQTASAMDVTKAELKREREAKKAAQVAADAAYLAEIKYWNDKANGNKSLAVNMRKRSRRIEAARGTSKPKNDFLAHDDPDNGHDFHAMMAEGSVRLCDAILAVRPLAQLP